MATGAPGTNGVWQYGEDDSEATFSALLNKAASTTDTQLGLDRARLTTLELPGRVIQVVNATYNTTVTNSSSTFVDTGLSATITPKSSSNKILVLISQSFGKTTGHPENSVKARLLRGASVICEPGSLAGYSPSAGFLNGIHVGTSFLDSPATTSAVIYKLQFANYVNQASVIANAYNERSTITLIEVKA